MCLLSANLTDKRSSEWLTRHFPPSLCIFSEITRADTTISHRLVRVKCFRASLILSATLFLQQLLQLSTSKVGTTFAVTVCGERSDSQWTREKTPELSSVNVSPKDPEKLKHRNTSVGFTEGSRTDETLSSTAPRTRSRSRSCWD